eukprot:32672_1
MKSFRIYDQNTYRDYRARITFDDQEEQEEEEEKTELMKFKAFISTTYNVPNGADMTVHYSLPNSETRVYGVGSDQQYEDMIAERNLDLIHINRGVDHANAQNLRQHQDQHQQHRVNPLPQQQREWNKQWQKQAFTLNDEFTGKEDVQKYKRGVERHRSLYKTSLTNEMMYVALSNGKSIKGDAESLIILNENEINTEEITVNEALDAGFAEIEYAADAEDIITLEEQVQIYRHGMSEDAFFGVKIKRIWDLLIETYDTTDRVKTMTDQLRSIKQMARENTLQYLNRWQQEYRKLQIEIGIRNTNKKIHRMLSKYELGQMLTAGSSNAAMSFVIKEGLKRYESADMTLEQVVTLLKVFITQERGIMEAYKMKLSITQQKQRSSNTHVMQQKEVIEEDAHGCDQEHRDEMYYIQNRGNYTRNQGGRGYGSGGRGGYGNGGNNGYNNGGGGRYQDRKKPLCMYGLKKLCPHGDKCSYRHYTDMADWAQHATAVQGFPCRKGDACRKYALGCCLFDHKNSRNPKAHPKHGKICRKGVRCNDDHCKFNHPCGKLNKMESGHSVMGLDRGSDTRYNKRHGLIKEMGSHSKASNSFVAQMDAVPNDNAPELIFGISPGALNQAVEASQIMMMQTEPVRRLNNVVYEKRKTKEEENLRELVQIDALSLQIIDKRHTASHNVNELEQKAVKPKKNDAESTMHSVVEVSKDKYELQHDNVHKKGMQMDIASHVLTKRLDWKAKRTKIFRISDTKLTITPFMDSGARNSVAAENIGDLLSEFKCKRNGRTLYVVAADKLKTHALRTRLRIPVDKPRFDTIRGKDYYVKEPIVLWIMPALEKNMIIFGRDAMAQMDIAMVSMCDFKRALYFHKRYNQYTMFANDEDSNRFFRSIEYRHEGDPGLGVYGIKPNGKVYKYKDEDNDNKNGADYGQVCIIETTEESAKEEKKTTDFDVRE